MKINTKFISSFLGLIILLGIIILAFVFMFKKPEAYIQGQADAKQVSVSSKIAGRIHEILVKEGDEVEAEQILAIMETPEIDAKLKQAESLRKAAEAQDKKALKGTRKEKIQAAYNVWQRVKAEAELAEKTYQRVQNLYNDKVVSAQKRDEAYTQSLAARKMEQAALSDYQMALNGAQIEDKEAASAQVSQAQGVVEEVASYKKEANIISPIQGEILKIMPNSGELINTGYPIINIVDLNDIWVVFNIKEELMGKFKKGNTFEARIPALDNQKVNLKIHYIAAQGDFATWSATKSRGDFDMKTFEIKAYPTQKINGLRPGMSVLINESSLK